MLLGTFSLVGGVSAGPSLLDSAGTLPLAFWLVPRHARASLPKDGERSRCHKCQLAIFIWLKLVFHVGNPRSEEDLELKTELFHYWYLNLESALLSNSFFYYEN